LFQARERGIFKKKDWLSMEELHNSQDKEITIENQAEDLTENPGAVKIPVFDVTLRIQGSL